MVLAELFLALCVTLGVQASPLEVEGFEDVDAEAVVIEAERGRSGRQLWDAQGHLINPFLTLSPDGRNGILYQGFGFQPGIQGIFPGGQHPGGHHPGGHHPGGHPGGWPGQPVSPVQPGQPIGGPGGHPGVHPGGHPGAGGWPGAGGSPGGWPGAGGSPGGWPAAPTHPPTTTRAPWTQPSSTAAPWTPPPTPKPTKAPVAAPVAPPASSGFAQCGQGKYGAIRYNIDGDVAEEINRINGTNPFRVVNGWPADKNEWPWQAALLNKGRQFCAGSLIDDRHILTAAHCVAHMSRNDVANLKIRLGAHYIKRGNEPGTHESKAARVVRHKGFSQQTLHWDVAIITMETPAPLNNPNIRPVCLPSGSQTYAEQTATVTGWGSLRENGPQPEELMEVTVRIWENAECKSTYGKAAPGGIESHMLCAGQKGKDSCNGDSGGPMVMGTGSTWSQIGVVSWGIGCGKSHYPGVYTRVTVVRDWIDRILRDY